MRHGDGRPVLDVELGSALAALGDPSGQRITPGNLAERQRRDAEGRPRPSATELRGDGRFAVEELNASQGRGSSGDGVTLVHVRPAGATGQLPLLYYLHGGGYVMGNAWSVLPRVLRDWCAPLGVAVVSAEYRLAPRAPYPATIDDCDTGLRWVMTHADDLGVDAERVIVGGKSAGGGLAAALAQMHRDRGDGPDLLGQLLMCPMLDDRLDTPSAHQADTGIWDRDSASVAWQAYLGDRYGTPGLSPYAAPARATDLAELPPAYLDVGSAEAFRDEVVDYARRIRGAGGGAELHVWPGAFHGFDSIAPGAALSLAAVRARTAWLSRVLS